MTRRDLGAVGNPRVRGAVVALTTVLTVALGAACSTSGGAGRPGNAEARTPSSTPSARTVQAPSPSPAGVGVARYRATTPVLDAAAPLRLEIPSIGVSTHLVPLGLNPDGTMQVPTKWEDAGWYTRGPRPGEDGPAVIAGHVDSTSGPAVFFRLHDLRAGDEVLVTRADHSVVRFVIDRLEQFPKASFPTAAVFGATPGPTLRLITCTGAFDETARSYLDNLVAFASPANS
jgi:hypothetical protein